MGCLQADDFGQVSPVPKAFDELDGAEPVVPLPFTEEDGPQEVLERLAGGGGFLGSLDQGSDPFCMPILSTDHRLLASRDRILLVGRVTSGPRARPPSTKLAKLAHGIQLPSVAGDQGREWVRFVVR